jgi:hypothetical protein
MQATRDGEHEGGHDRHTDTHDHDRERHDRNSSSSSSVDDDSSASMTTVVLSYSDFLEFQSVQQFLGDIGVEWINASMKDLVQYVPSKVVFKFDAALVHGRVGDDASGGFVTFNLFFSADTTCVRARAKTTRPPPSFSRAPAPLLLVLSSPLCFRACAHWSLCFSPRARAP